MNVSLAKDISRLGMSRAKFLDKFPAKSSEHNASSPTYITVAPYLYIL